MMKCCVCGVEVEDALDTSNLGTEFICSYKCLMRKTDNDDKGEM
jgi:hypothetical protein